jgi:hypothetical protein
MGVLDTWERGTDRKEILRQLSDLAVEEPILRSEYNGWLLSSLEQTVAPRKSKPGSVDSIIDDLTEYWAEPGFRSQDDPDRAGQASYWKVVLNSASMPFPLSWNTWRTTG